MKTIEIEIEGICPILFNRFTDEAQEQLEKGSGGKKKGKKEKITEAGNKVYRDKAGFIGIPALNIKKSMLIGCQMAGIKLGRRSLMPYMRATVFISPEIVSLGKKETDGIHECTGRIPPRTGAMAILRRPYMDTGWKAGFQIQVFDERVSVDLIEEALKEAGSVVALCDHRPEYGRFKINKFKVT